MTASKTLDPSSLPVGPFSRTIIDAKSNDGESNDGERSSGNNLGDLLDQISENSVGEVDGLIGELRQMRAKLQADRDRIKRDIEKYETLSQQVIQLTKIISESVATLVNNHKQLDSTPLVPSISWPKAD